MTARHFIGLLVSIIVAAEAWGTAMRRPISPAQPVWLVHIDHSYGEDAQTCIDAIPDDVLPYVVFNIAVTNAEQYATIEQDLATCEANGVWAMVQPSAGTRSSMSDTDATVYEQLYKNYSCLIGYNFCEQNWGFDAASLKTRLALFVELLRLADEYGGYLYVNDAQSLSNNPINTIAKMKASADYAAATRQYADHFIYGHKTTMGYGYYDNESACLGMFLSGHAGHYAIRFDQYAWSYSGRGQVFAAESNTAMPNSLAWFSCPEAAMGAAIVEQVMLNGATVIDGPEIPIINCLYKGRQTPAFKNMVCDIVRHVADGTIPIPSREEVLERTHVAFVCNQYNTVGDDTPLYEGLYQVDGHRRQNRSWLKAAGRYPTIPTMATTDDAENFDIIVAQKGDHRYTDRWTDTDAKVDELSQLYPAVSTGDLFVGKSGEAFLAYNPYLNTNQTATADIPLDATLAQTLGLSFTPHTFCVVNAKEQELHLYLNNYRTDKDDLWAQYPKTSEDDGLARMTQSTVQSYMLNTFIDHPTHDQLRESVVRLTGCKRRPVVRWTDRGYHATSTVQETWTNGTLTLTIRHNGPLDITVFEDEAAGVTQPSSSATIDDSALYNLTGQRVSLPRKGMLVIQKGRKALARQSGLL